MKSELEGFGFVPIGYKRAHGFRRIGEVLRTGQEFMGLNAEYRQELVSDQYRLPSE